MKTWLRSVCKYGEEGSCRYLTNDPKGFACGKLDERIAQALKDEPGGDNCNGLPITHILSSEDWRDEEPIPDFKGMNIKLSHRPHA